MPEQTPTVSWWWDWVPGAGTDAAERAAWRDSVTAVLDRLAGEAAAGAAVARDLQERADLLAPHCHLVWGVGFLGDQARWLPQLVLVEFREAAPGDSAYLMSVVGAEGFDGDVREPSVEYVSTGHGDGVRVLAVARAEDGQLYGRVHAALRLERPAADLDVLLTSRVTGLSQLAVIGDGIDALLTTIATDGTDAS